MADPIAFEVGGEIVAVPLDEARWLHDQLKGAEKGTPRNSAYVKIDAGLQIPEGAPLELRDSELEEMLTAIQVGLGRDPAVGDGLIALRGAIHGYLG
jgi:hypothetical protein